MNNTTHKNYSSKNILEIHKFLTGDESAMLSYITAVVAESDADQFALSFSEVSKATGIRRQSLCEILPSMCKKLPGYLEFDEKNHVVTIGMELAKELKYVPRDIDNMIFRMHGFQNSHILAHFIFEGKEFRKMKDFFNIKELVNTTGMSASQIAKALYRYGFEFETKKNGTAIYISSYPTYDDFQLSYKPVQANIEFDHAKSFEELQARLRSNSQQFGDAELLEEEKEEKEEKESEESIEIPSDESLDADIEAVDKEDNPDTPESFEDCLNTPVEKPVKSQSEISAIVGADEHPIDAIESANEVRIRKERITGFMSKEDMKEGMEKVLADVPRRHNQTPEDKDFLEKLESDCDEAQKVKRPLAQIVEKRNANKRFFDNVDTFRKQFLSVANRFYVFSSYATNPMSMERKYGSGCQIQKIFCDIANQMMTNYTNGLTREEAELSEKFFQECFGTHMETKQFTDANGEKKTVSKEVCNLDLQFIQNYVLEHSPENMKKKLEMKYGNGNDPRASFPFPGVTLGADYDDNRSPYKYAIVDIPDFGITGIVQGRLIAAPQGRPFADPESGKRAINAVINHKWEAHTPNPHICTQDKIEKNIIERLAWGQESFQNVEDDVNESIREQMVA